MTAPTRPAPSAVIVENIPLELRESQQWVLWRYAWVNDKWTKVPYQPLGMKASTTNPVTWSPFQTVMTFYRKGGFDGVGRVFSADDPYVGVDLDHCRDATSGAIEPWAWNVITSICSYTEVSVSGTGVHMIMRGSLPPKGNKRGQCETYQHGRYFTFTGQPVLGAPLEIKERQEALMAFWNEYIKPPEPAPISSIQHIETIPVDDTDLLDKARQSVQGKKFIALYDRGDLSLFGGDDSAADMSLIDMLSWWTNKDAGRIERLFSASALGQRSKWRDRPDYRARTIEKALGWPNGGYDPSLRINGHGQFQPAKHIEPVDVPAFPVDVLPEALQRYVEHASALMACPPEYVAVPLLVTAGTALGNVVRVRINGNWSEGPQLFAAIVGDPGSKKSPAIKAGTAPLKSLEKWLYDGWRQKQGEYLRDVEGWKAAKKSERGEEPRAPAYPYVLVNDVTVEKLAEILGSSKGVALIHDELAGWVSSMGQYKGGKGADRQHYLSMWSASSFNVDRVKNPIPVRVVNPCLGVIGAMVPEMLGSLADEKGRADGFMDRILWAYPEMIPDKWVDDDGENADAIELEKLWQWLYSVQQESVTLSAEAYAVWVRWYNDHVQPRNDKTLKTEMQGPWAKMLSQLPRLALILHYIDRPTEKKIAANTLERAITLIDYFKAHADRVYEELGASPGSDELKVLEALKKHGSMSQNTLRSQVFSRHIASEKLLEMLAKLEERGLVSRYREETGGRPVTMWGPV